MLRSPHQRTIVVLGVAVVVGLAATVSSQASLTVSAAWPVGLLSGVAVRQPTRGLGYAVLLVGTVGMLATYRLGGNPWAESLAVTAAQGLGAATVAAVLTSYGRRRALLRSEKDIAWYALSAVSGGVVAGAVAAACSVTVLDGGAVRAAVGLGAQHLASQLVLLPWFVGKRTHRGLAGRREQVAQWAVLLVVTTLVFGLGDRPVLAVAVLVVLAWGARRLGTLATLLQLLVVIVIAGSFTYLDAGPFTDPGLFLGLDTDVPLLLMQFFTICCSLVVVPLVLTVSLQQQAVRSASVERDRAQRIIASAESVVIIGGSLDAITYFSPGAERLLGYRAEDVVGRRLRLVSDRELGRLCAELGVEGFQGVCHALVDTPGSHQVRLRRKDGVERTHLASVRSVSTDEGLEFVLISEDVTARVEEQQAQDAAIERLREVDLAKDAFVSGVSHELRTPLTSIAGFVELLQDDAYGRLTDEQHEALGRVAANAERLLGLVDDLLTNARLDADDSGIERAPVDLCDVVRTACRLVEPTWVARSITTRLVLPDAPVVVEGDRGMVERVVVNLVGNAVKFTAEHGRVEVRVRRGERHAELEVADTGIGIPADELDRLFTRFFRSRLARQRAVQGTGLGLAIAKSVVEAHGGEIEVRSTEGAGTTVVARLPLAPPGMKQDSTIVGQMS